MYCAVIALLLTYSSTWDFCDVRCRWTS